MTNCNCESNDYLNGCGATGVPCPPLRPEPPCVPCPPKPGCTSNNTKNYGLPLWRASDVTSWLMQMNGAMIRIDEVMHELALRTGIAGVPDDIVKTVQMISGDVEVIKCQIGDISNKAANNELLMQNINTQFGAMQTDMSSLQLSITNLDTRLMTQDSANQQNKNNISMIKADLNVLSDTVKNIRQNTEQFQQVVNTRFAEIQAQLLEISKSDIKTVKLQAASDGGNYTMDKVTCTNDSYALSPSSVINGFYVRATEYSGGLVDLYLRTPNSILTVPPDGVDEDSLINYNPTFEFDVSELGVIIDEKIEPSCISSNLLFGLDNDGEIRLGILCKMGCTVENNKLTKITMELFGNATPIKHTATIKQITFKITERGRLEVANGN